MKLSNDTKLTILPLSVLIILAILWKVTEAVSAGVIVILFWVGWRQLIKKHMKY